MTAVSNVLIVGGGIAGQTLGCALAKRGIACEIVEVMRDWAISGTAMTIHGNALRAFHDIGVVDDIVAASWHRPSRPIVFTDAQGEVIFEPEDPNVVGPGYPAMVAVRRQLLHEILTRAVARAKVPVRMGTTVDALNETGSGVEVTFSDGTRRGYDLVVGADGIRSKVRALTFGNIEPQLAGFGSWRAILPRPKALEVMIWMWGKGKTLGLLPVSDDLVYFAGVTKEETKVRYRQEDLPRLFPEKFGSFGGLVPEVMASISSPDQLLFTAMEEVKLPPPWFKGRVVVLGDAAHAATPFWAQGAAMAIEDSILLAQLLEKHTQLTACLEEWMGRRYDRCMFVQEGSYQTGRQIHRDAEDDKPKVFPPPVREALKAEAARRSARLAEPI